ncbi:hypothetical protein PHYPO_G00154330 [Pangasianodon hypophthalmus]|uniref:Uncharacterized protein n=1 Tax=Pangasianodon hypophthalmus TaxID=310915 RepID=A0A5N5K8Y6_PANHP|nr:hypothetical protein PHYPO_G00154330 [Pangasianodon hypophthalmus]
MLEGRDGEQLKDRCSGEKHFPVDFNLNITLKTQQQIITSTSAEVDLQGQNLPDDALIKEKRFIDVMGSMSPSCSTSSHRYRPHPPRPAPAAMPYTRGNGSVQPPPSQQQSGSGNDNGDDPSPASARALANEGNEDDSRSPVPETNPTSIYTPTSDTPETQGEEQASLENAEKLNEPVQESRDGEGAEQSDTACMGDEGTPDNTTK